MRALFIAWCPWWRLHVPPLGVVGLAAVFFLVASIGTVGVAVPALGDPGDALRIATFGPALLCTVAARFLDTGLAQIEADAITMHRGIRFAWALGWGSVVVMATTVLPMASEWAGRARAALVLWGLTTLTCVFIEASLAGAPAILLTGVAMMTVGTQNDVAGRALLAGVSTSWELPAAILWVVSVSAAYAWRYPGMARNPIVI